MNTPTLPPPPLQKASYEPTETDPTISALLEETHESFIDFTDEKNKLLIKYKFEYNQNVLK